MKSQHNSNPVTVVTYENSEVEQMITKVHLEIRDQAVQRAETLAEAKKPGINDDLYNSTSWITAKYDALRARVLKHLNIEGMMSKGESLLKRFNAEEQELRAKHTECESILRKTNKEFTDRSAGHILDRINAWKRVNFLIILLLGSEAIATEQAMAAITALGILARLGIALALSIFTYFVAKFHISYSRGIASRRVKMLFHLGMLSLVFGLFFGLANMRMVYLTEMNPDLASRTSTILLMVVSGAFYIGTCFATSMHSVDTIDRERAKNFLRKKAEVERLEEQLAELERELKELPERREMALYECYSLIKMAEKYLLEIEHLYAETIGEFVLANSTARHDGHSLTLSQFKGGVVPPLQSIQLNPEHL